MSKKPKKSLLKLVQQFKDEHDLWVEAGSPVRSAEEMLRIYKICEACPHFVKDGGMLPTYDQCSICGCNLHPTHTVFNKLVYGTTECPDEPRKW